MMSLSMGMADSDSSAPGLNLSQAWCEAMEQDTVCMCSPGWELVPINISAIAPSNPELHIMMDNLDWWLEGVCLPIIALIGVCGNIVSIMVLTNKDIDLKPSFVNILICLAIYDLLFEILAILVYSLEHLSPQYKDHVYPFLMPYLLPLIHICLTGSVYTTIAVAVERCLTVLAPFTQIKSYNGFLYLCPIIIFSFLYNIPKFFEVRTQCSVSVTATQIANIAAVVEGSDKINWTASAARSEKNYMIYITANCILMGLLPMVVLAVLNWLIYRAISRARALHASLNTSSTHRDRALNTRQTVILFLSFNSPAVPRRDNTMATVLTAIVFVFILCHAPKAALNIYEVGTKLIPRLSVVTGQPVMGLVENIIANISHILIVTNSAVNIVVYAMKDFKFRHVLCSWVCGPPSASGYHYHHPTKKQKAAARSGDTGPSTHLAISTNMVDIDISVDNSMDGALEPIKTTMDQETKVLTTDF